MKIAVGSANPVKIEAVRDAAKKMFPEAEVVSAAVQSGVSAQPFSDDEAIEGAENRARAAMKEKGADFGVGLEGTVEHTKHGLFTSGWVVVLSRDGKKGIAQTGSLLLPDKITKQVTKDKELGTVMDELVGEKDVKKNLGAIGIFSKGIITRKSSFEQAVIKAFARFMTDYYD